MSGDGIYWRDILQATLKFATQPGLAIWPKISESETTTYVDLKSSLAVAKDLVRSEVLIPLARVGLTLVQLPQTHMQFLDNSITKLTPRAACYKRVTFFVTFRHALFVPLFILCLLSLYSLFTFVYSRSRVLRTSSFSHVYYHFTCYLPFITCIRYFTC